MESKKINQLATELTPALSDLTIIGDPTTGISKKITLSQMASLFTGTVEEYANLASFPLVGTADTIYIALDTNVIYRWNTGTSAYVELSPNIVTSLVFSDANGFDGTISLVGSTATLTITTALTQGSVPFIGASGALSQDNANLFFDDTNNRLGINTNTPTTALDVFGSGIIGRLNGTSTNNAFLGFASAGSNKWSIGNVQSDHRFRIYNEATTSELVSVLQTGEFGIGIANPTTKLHIDGGASALIANLDANVSVAKSISFRSDNSARINLEVSGTESGSNAGADLFIRRYSDAGALIDTPLTITRSTGAATFSSSVTATEGIFSSGGVDGSLGAVVRISTTNTNGNARNWALVNTYESYGDLNFRISTAQGGNALTAGTTIMTLNRSGNVGIGTSSPTSSTNYTALNINGTTGSEIYLNGSNVNYGYMYANSGGVALASQTAIPLVFQTNATERMRITSSGNVGIGTSSPAGSWPLTTKGTYGIVAQASANTSGIYMWHDGTDGLIQTSYETTGGFGAIKFLTSTTERMRITSGGYFKASVDGTYLSTGAFHEIRSNAVGNLMVLQQTASSGTLYGIDVYYSGQAPNNTTSTFITFYDNVNTKAIIYSNGTFGSRTNTYSSISDIKLKENITPATPKLNDLLKVNVVNYNFIDDEKKQKQIGVISQELEEIFPNMVFESEDYKEVEIIDEEGNITKEKQYLGTKTKSVKYSIFVPMLIKAIQEQQAQIDELKLLINK